MPQCSLALKCRVVWKRLRPYPATCLAIRCDASDKRGDSRSVFELRGDGQVKLGQDGQFCLSQHGVTAGRRNVASQAAAAASSTADAVSHGAGMAVDGRSSPSYWASQLDVAADPVEFSVDLGRREKLQYAEIAWEFPAKAFSILLSEGDAHWMEVFATDVNTLSLTRAPLGSKFASKVKALVGASCAPLSLACRLWRAPVRPQSPPAP